jgi:hypothetical protein
MSTQSVVYAVRLSREVKEQLPQAARRYNFLNSQELVRAVLGLIVTGQVELTLLEVHNHSELEHTTSL